MPSFVSTKAEMVCSGILPIDQLRDHVPPVALISFLGVHHGRAGEVHGGWAGKGEACPGSAHFLKKGGRRGPLAREGQSFRSPMSGNSWGAEGAAAHPDGAQLFWSEEGKQPGGGSLKRERGGPTQRRFLHSPTSANGSLGQSWRPPMGSASSGHARMRTGTGHPHRRSFSRPWAVSNTHTPREAPRGCKGLCAGSVCLKSTSCRETRAGAATWTLVWRVTSGVAGGGQGQGQGRPGWGAWIMFLEQRTRTSYQKKPLAETWARNRRFSG